MVKNYIKKLLLDNTGSTAVEYALIAALILLASIGAMTSMSSSMLVKYNIIFTAVSSAIN